MTARRTGAASAGTPGRVRPRCLSPLRPRHRRQVAGPNPFRPTVREHCRWVAVSGPDRPYDQTGAPMRPSPATHRAGAATPARGAASPPAPPGGQEPAAPFLSLRGPFRPGNHVGQDLLTRQHVVQRAPGRPVVVDGRAVPAHGTRGHAEHSGHPFTIRQRLVPAPPDDHRVTCPWPLGTSHCRRRARPARSSWPILGSSASQIPPPSCRSSRCHHTGCCRFSTWSSGWVR